MSQTGQDRQTDNGVNHFTNGRPKIEDGGGRHLEKSPYLCNGLTKKIEKSPVWLIVTVLLFILPIKTANIIKLECGPMPNVMAALPNIGGALCSTPQSLADVQY